MPVYDVDTVVVGAGAAGLRCAVALSRNLKSQPSRRIAILTEDLRNSTSYNTGSDKQTFYTWGVARETGDSPRSMAEQLYAGGSLDGDIATVQGNLSARAFYGLAELGVPFPHDVLGGYGGYVTDHSPHPRGTSTGPLTSRDMVEALIGEVQTRGVPVFDRHLLLALVVHDVCCCGLLAMDTSSPESPDFGFRLFRASNVVLAVGGPGGLYRSSVYPTCHNGGIGVALEAGTRAANLTESQHGLASVRFRWNVSGTYQQAIPRYFSAAADGSDEREFLNPHFGSMGALASTTFLKGYQWPFDAARLSGSSLIDVLVYRETEIERRRVFLDFRENPRSTGTMDAFNTGALSDEARSYLDRAGALELPTPLSRLAHMNPQAVALYASKGIDLATEPLEVRVCAQHNNGGLETDANGESTNTRRLFAIGEVAGHHGVYRPGGSALNAGQSFAIMAAERIAFGEPESARSGDDFDSAAAAVVAKFRELSSRLTRRNGAATVASIRDRIRERMTRVGAHVRGPGIHDALTDAYAEIAQCERATVASASELPDAFVVRSFAFAHAAYLEAIAHYRDHGGGSRGSYLVLDESGEPLLTELGDAWRWRPEDESWSERVLLTEFGEDGRFRSWTRPRRPLPELDFQFEREMNRYVPWVRGIRKA